ncbi:MAG: hypothetical protein ABFC94_18860 [Syntrophomonas sp.]
MRTSDKKEYMMVLVLLLLILGAGLIMSSRHSELVFKYPDHPAILNTNDFSVNTGNGILEIGKSSFADVAKLYPQGRTLGMSTVYSPKNSGCLFTFSKKSNILITIHINTNQTSTFRHITLNDSFASVVKAYGKNYARVSQKGDTANFDAVYGAESSIVFQIRNNLVKKIIIQKEAK